MKCNSMNISPTLCYGLVAILAITSCTSKKEADEKTINGVEVDDALNITKAHFQAADMRLDTLEIRPFHKIVRANGIIDVPPQNKASVSVYFGGYVKALTLLPGKKIKKGEVLFVLENPDYVQIQQDFLEAEGQLDYLQSNYQRQKNLVEDGVTSQKSYLKAKADYTATRAKYQALKKKLRLMGINPDKLTQNNMRTNVIIKAPLGGYVTQVNITEGIYLHPADIAVSITNTDHLHLELSIFEKDANRVAINQLIKFIVGQDKTKIYDADVLLVNKYVDPKKRTINVHGHLKDEKNTSQFSPGMYVEAEIYTSSYTSPSLREEAVVDVDNKQYVLVVTEQTDTTYSFSKREVKTGQINDGYIEIVSHEAFGAGTKFLTKGAFKLIKE